MNKIQAKRNIKLAEALESGEFKQGKGCLRYRDLQDGEDYFCCLGVACQLYREKASFSLWAENIVHANLLFMGKENYPPQNVVDYYGWDGTSPKIVIGKKSNSAAEFNDTGKSFKLIAKGFRRLAEQVLKPIKKGKEKAK